MSDSPQNVSKVGGTKALHGKGLATSSPPSVVLQLSCGQGVSLMLTLPGENEKLLEIPEVAFNRAGFFLIAFQDHKIQG